MASLLGELVLLSGRYKGRRIPLAREVLRIGREASCDIALEDEAASRRHAEIVNHHGKLILRDLRSTNGTYVNGARVEVAPLQNGDRIRIGDTVLLVELSPSSVWPSPRVVFSTEQRHSTTRLTLNLNDTRFLQIGEAAAPDAQRNFTRLYEFMVTVTGVSNRAALLERTLDTLLRTFEADRGAIILVDAEGKPSEKLYRVRGGLSVRQEEALLITHQKMRELVERKESFLSVEQGPTEEGKPADGPAPLYSVMGVPLKLKDRILGVLYLEKAPQSTPFTEQDLKLFTAMALQAAVCLENASFYDDLLDAMAFNSSILRSLTSGLLVLDMQGVVIRTNVSALEVLRLEEAELINRPLASFPVLAEMNRIIQQTLVSGQPQDRYEVPLHFGDEVVTLGLTTSPFTDHTGRKVGVVASFRNLTHVHRLEQQLRRSRHLAALGQMAAGVAHEIRNPLNSIRGFTQLVQQTLPQPDSATKCTEYTRIVIEEVDRMNRIVQDLLDFSRQREPTMVPLNLGEVLRELLQDVEAEYQAAQLTLALEVPESLPRVMGNRDKLRQVWRNILTNARQASSAGGRVEVAVSLLSLGDAHLPHRANCEVAVAVRDYGVGIEPAYLNRIFDPFFTLKDSGTGLGLSISQKIVDQHGGRIEVQSEPGKGSTFTVFLSVPETETTGEEARQTPAGTAQPPEPARLADATRPTKPARRAEADGPAEPAKSADEDAAQG